MSEEAKLLRVLIVDDHAVVRSGLRAVLEDEEGLEIAGEAASADEAVEKARTMRPDVVLMDIRMDEGDDASGIDACRQIRSELPDTQVIMCTSYSEQESVLASIMAGATGFLTKNVPQLIHVDYTTGLTEIPDDLKDCVYKLGAIESLKLAGGGKMPGVAFQDYVEARLIIVWGCNPGATGIHLLPFIREARKRGARLVVVDPRRTKLARSADLHLAAKPGTDVALALALGNWLFENGHADTTFLAAHAAEVDGVNAKATVLVW